MLCKSQCRNMGSLETREGRETNSLLKLSEGAQPYWPIFNLHQEQKIHLCCFKPQNYVVFYSGNRKLLYLLTKYYSFFKSVHLIDFLEGKIKYKLYSDRCLLKGTKPFFFFFLMNTIFDISQEFYPLYSLYRKKLLY